MRLTQLIARYVTFRKRLSQDFESDEKRLRTFSRFVGESTDIRSVKQPRVAAFLNGSGPVTRYWHLKYGTLRGFFSYAVTRGYLSTSPLPATVPKPPARFVPYIYSREELRRLLNGTASYQKHKTRIVMEPDLSKIHAGYDIKSPSAEFPRKSSGVSPSQRVSRILSLGCHRINSPWTRSSFLTTRGRPSRMTMIMACRKKSQNVAHAKDGIRLKKLKNSGNLRNSPTTRLSRGASM